MKRIILAFVFAAPLCPGAAFTISSVKPSELPMPGGAVPLQITAGSLRCVCSLQSLILAAYQLPRDQILFPQGLRDSDVYQVSATFPEGARKDVPLMLRELLRERFHLVAHREMRDTPIYALVLAKSGLKLKPSPVPATIEEAIKNPAKSHFLARVGVRTDRLIVSGSGTLDEIARGIRIDRLVINMTGDSSRRYDFSIDAVVPPRPGAMPFILQGAAPGSTDPSPDDPPSIFSAVKSMGLELQPRRIQQEWLIIDKLNNVPAAN